MAKKILRTSLFAAGVLCVFLAAPALAQDPAQLLASGRSAYESGEYERARTDLWAYLEATANLSGASRLPQAEALYLIAQMEPDAAVSTQHYTTIVQEYPAASVADEALFRLGTYALVTGRPAEARTRFLELRQNYPFSRFQGEIALWAGRSFLAEGSHRAATDAFIEGFSRVRTQDLPYEIAGPQRDALAAEYAYWLATAFNEEGDEQTAMQYWSMLAFDYPHSPQAAEARSALAALGRPVAEPAGGRGQPPVVMEEPPREEPSVVMEPVREEEEAPLPPAEEPPVETPPPGGEEAPKFPPPAASGAAYLQVGAFTSAARAADLSKRLREDGFQSSVEIGIVGGQGYYRVRVGPYNLPSESESLRASEERLQRMGYPSQRVDAGS
jgi:cell division septation protein DedD